MDHKIHTIPRQKGQPSNTAIVRFRITGPGNHGPESLMESRQERHERVSLHRKKEIEQIEQNERVQAQMEAFGLYPNQSFGTRDRQSTADAYRLLTPQVVFDPVDEAVVYDDHAPALQRLSSELKRSQAAQHEATKNVAVTFPECDRRLLGALKMLEDERERLRDETLKLIDAQQQCNADGQTWPDFQRQLKGHLRKMKEMEEKLKRAHREQETMKYREAQRDVNTRRMQQDLADEREKLRGVTTKLERARMELHRQRIQCAAEMQRQNLQLQAITSKMMQMQGIPRHESEQWVREEMGSVFEPPLPPVFEPVSEIGEDVIGERRGENIRVEISNNEMLRNELKSRRRRLEKIEGEMARLQMNA